MSSGEYHARQRANELENREREREGARSGLPSWQCSHVMLTKTTKAGGTSFLCHGEKGHAGPHVNDSSAYRIASLEADVESLRALVRVLADQSHALAMAVLHSPAYKEHKAEVDAVLEMLDVYGKPRALEPRL